MTKTTINLVKGAAGEHREQHNNKSKDTLITFAPRENTWGSLISNIYRQVYTNKLIFVLPTITVRCQTV